jgi:hypothetical protein
MANNTDPKQIVCTGEQGTDVWNCAFGTWSDDDFGIDSDEAVGKGERLYVRRDLYDNAANIALALFGLLDDCDTADDIAKGDDLMFRALVRAAHKKRFLHASTDGNGVTINAPT